MDRSSSHSLPWLRKFSDHLSPGTRAGHLADTPSSCLISRYDPRMPPGQAPQYQLPSTPYVRADIAQKQGSLLLEICEMNYNRRYGEQTPYLRSPTDDLSNANTWSASGVTVPGFRQGSNWSTSVESCFSWGSRTEIEAVTERPSLLTPAALCQGSPRTSKLFVRRAHLNTR